ncbi:MAG: hypothetical protein AAF299_08990 [Pseudomonadota bacterium]
MLLGKLREFMMSESGDHERATHVGRSLSWWLVTYLFYALAFLFTFTSAFPTAASPADHIIVDIVNLAIFLFPVIFLLSMFIFRKFLILFSCSVMFSWVAFVFAGVILSLPGAYRMGGEDALRAHWSLFFLMFAPAFVFLGLTTFRIMKRNKANTGD